jgi:hypothetical protein
MLRKGHKQFFKNFELQFGIQTAIILWSLFVCLNSFVYIFFGITQIGALIVLLSIIFFSFFLLNKKVIKYEYAPTEVQTSDQKPWYKNGLGYVIFLDIFLLFILWQTRVDFPLRTPWLQIPTSFFVLFGLSSLVLLFLFETRRFNNHISVSVLSLHYLLFFGTLIFVFRFGFGYDSIIHQASEIHIAKFGQLLPLKPFYIGQYATVVSFHLLLGMPIWLVDRVLVPLFASITLPLLSFYSLHHGYGVKRQRALALSACIFLFPISEFTFTVPHNLSVLYLMWWIFLLPFYQRFRGFITLFLIACAAALTHPLSGIPLLIMTFLVYCLRAIKESKSTVASYLIACSTLLCVIFVAVSPMLMFAFYRIKIGLPPFVVRSFADGFEYWLNLFRSPYVFSGDIPLRTLYQWGYFYWFTFPIIACLGLVFVKKIFPFRKVFFAFLIGILGSTFCMAMFMQIPGVKPWEQDEFVLRLKSLLPIISIPAVLLVIDTVLEGIKRRSILVGFIFFIAATMTINYYFIYPQENRIATFTGWNIGKGDAEAVRIIDQITAGKPYVVLTDQLVSAVALRDLGYHRTLETAAGDHLFIYPIAADELLAPYADKALYESIIRSDIDELHKRTGASVFIVVHNFWYRLEQIINEVSYAGGTEISSPPTMMIWRFY